MSPNFHIMVVSGKPSTTIIKGPSNNKIGGLLSLPQHQVIKLEKNNSKMRYKVMTNMK